MRNQDFDQAIELLKKAERLLDEAYEAHCQEAHCQNREARQEQMDVGMRPA